MIISTVKICRACRQDLTGAPKASGPLGPVCPYCSKLLQEKGSTKAYETPDYIFHQKNSLLEQLNKDKLKTGTDKHIIASQDIALEQSMWFRVCDDADRIAALHDAYGVMQELVHSGATKHTTTGLISMAKKIGELGQAIETYFKKGGVAHDREAGSIRPDIGEDTSRPESLDEGRDF